jgi:hypothetical protein
VSDVRKLIPLALLAACTGCQSGSSQTRRVETAVNVTHEVAFGDYRRVFNTTYHIVNRYGVVQTSSYKQGEITALVSEDTSLWDKTRKTIQARIIDTGDYWDVQCRVLIAVEGSEIATFEEQFHPLYEWRTVASDPQLEVRLNNEIRAALSGGAWQAREPLTPKPVAPATPVKPRKAPAKPANKRAGSDDEGEVSDRGPVGTASRAGAPDAAAFERLGVLRMRRGSYAGAARSFQAALEAGRGEAPFAHFLLGQALFSQGEFDEALAAVSAGTRANPDWAQADLDVRSLYPDEGADFRAQLAALERSAAADDRLEALLGYMRLYSGDPSGALEAFDRHAVEHPDSELTVGYRAAARDRVDVEHGLEDF